MDDETISSQAVFDELAQSLIDSSWAACIDVKAPYSKSDEAAAHMVLQAIAAGDQGAALRSAPPGVQALALNMLYSFMVLLRGDLAGHRWPRRPAWHLFVAGIDSASPPPSGKH